MSEITRLPVITEQMLEDFGDDGLIDSSGTYGPQWSQLAVDFACVIKGDGYNKIASLKAELAALRSAPPAYYCQKCPCEKCGNTVARAGIPPPGKPAHGDAKGWEIERAYQMLEVNGVPRERAKSVSNGISVLVNRMAKENAALHASPPTVKHHENCDTNDKMITGKPCNCRDSSGKVLHDWDASQPPEQAAAVESEDRKEIERLRVAMRQARELCSSKNTTDGCQTRMERISHTITMALLPTLTK
jgi:hypothetical protein